MLTKLAPSRESLIAESSPQMQELLIFCLSHVNVGEVIDVSHAHHHDGCEHSLFDLIEHLMASEDSSPDARDEAAEITRRKLLWKHHIDDNGPVPVPRGGDLERSRGQRFYSSDLALTGSLSAKAQSKALQAFADDLMRIVRDRFPAEKWPQAPEGARIFKTHGRRGDGATYIVDNERMMQYARNVAGHFRPYFKKKDTETGEYVAEFTSVRDGAQIFNFDQILEAKDASSILVVDGVPCTINLIGDSLKEPFWPQGTGVNRGVSIRILCTR